VFGHLRNIKTKSGAAAEKNQQKTATCRHPRHLPRSSHSPLSRGTRTNVYVHLSQRYLSGISDPKARTVYFAVGVGCNNVLVGGSHTPNVGSHTPFRVWVQKVILFKNTFYSYSTYSTQLPIRELSRAIQPVTFSIDKYILTEGGMGRVSEGG